MRFLKVVLLCTCVAICAGGAQAQWVMQKTGVTASLRGLSVVDDNVVWASGSRGTYLRTTDRGNTWTAGRVSGAEGLDFRGVKAFDANTALLMSSGPAEQGQARIFRTEDGGANWKLVYSNTTAGVFLDAIAFWDRQHGIAVGDPAGGHFFVIVSDDGGSTWRQISGGRFPPALPGEGAFAASNSCLAVQGSSQAWFVTGGAGSARVFRSADRGRSWQVTRTPIRAVTASAGLFSVSFRDARNGVAVGGDYRQPTTSAATVAVSRDGGRSWKLAASPATGLFLSGVVWTRVSEPGRAGHRPAPTQAIAVGSAGWAESSDGGLHWQKGGDEGFNVVVVGRSAVWAAGSEGRVVRMEVVQ